MKRSEKEARAKRIVQFFQNIADGCKTTTYRHFKAEGVPSSTIYNVLKRYSETGTADFHRLSGRPASVSTRKVVNAVEKAFKKQPDISVRQLSSKMNISKSTLSDIKINKLRIKARTKKIVPKYVKDQAARAKSGARFVLDKSRQKVLIIDDETYVPFDPQEVPGRKFYHSSNPKEVSYDEKTKKKSKFFKKYLVWQAMDRFGNVSEPYITTGTINAEIYLNECLKKRLIPFIRKHHSTNSVLFWPDLASVHYAKRVLEFLGQENIEFIPKSKNPPNLPQARPIEEFWSICKQEYSKRHMPPKNLTGFKRIWKKLAADVAETHGQHLMDHGYSMLTKISKSGVEC